MKRIFWGMLLIMIDLTIMNGVFYLDLLPDFLGVLLCLWGMAQLDDVWHESRIRGFLCFYAFYTVADLLMGMYGIIFSPITMSLMPVLSNIMTLYLAAELTGMIRHMENQTCCLYGKELHASWSLLCIFAERDDLHLPGEGCRYAVRCIWKRSVAGGDDHHLPNGLFYHQHMALWLKSFGR